METVTIACPPGFTDPNVDPLIAPIRVDTNGVEYRVTSGYMEVEYTSTEPALAQPDRVNVLVGPDAITALSMMGLSVKAEQGQEE